VQNIFVEFILRKEITDRITPGMHADIIVTLLFLGDYL